MNVGVNKLKLERRVLIGHEHLTVKKRLQTGRAVLSTKVCRVKVS